MTNFRKTSGAVAVAVLYFEHRQGGDPKPQPLTKMNITFNDIKELATEYGFDLAQMRDDYVNNRVTADELWTRLNEEISADMGY